MSFSVRSPIPDRPNLTGFMLSDARCQVTCPDCHQPYGEDCHSPGGRRYDQPHTARVRLLLEFVPKEVYHLGKGRAAAVAAMRKQYPEYTP